MTDAAVIERPFERGVPRGTHTTFDIAGVGIALPASRLSNTDLARDLSVEEQWIERRCGVQSRWIACEETTCSLAAEAARAALAHANVQPDLVICATFTPDHPLCPVAPSIARAIHAGTIPAFDINAACTGGLVGVLMAADLLYAGHYRSILVVASDTTTKFLRPEDARTRILMSDGAAALLLTHANAGHGWRIVSRQMGSDGTGAALFRVPAGGSASPTGGERTVLMDGQGLFRFALSRGTQLVHDLCVEAGCRPGELSRVIFHQANRRIVDALVERLHIEPTRCVVRLDSVGNLAAASVLHALVTDLQQCGRPGNGERVLLAAFGAGLTWAGAILEC
jgi:3-oxoacyl-(acyl-carrier-protein) synthase III